MGKESPRLSTRAASSSVVVPEAVAARPLRGTAIQIGVGIHEQLGTLRERFSFLYSLRMGSMERSMTKELQTLVDLARQIEMTPDQLRVQRRSFAYGNTHIENSRITREMVADLDNKLESEKK